MSRPVAALLQAARSDLLAARNAADDYVFAAGHRILSDVQAGRLPRRADAEVVQAYLHKQSAGQLRIRESAWESLQASIRAAMADAGV